MQKKLEHVSLQLAQWVGSWLNGGCGGSISCVQKLNLGGVMAQWDASVYTRIVLVQSVNSALLLCAQQGIQYINSKSGRGYLSTHTVHKRLY